MEEEEGIIDEASDKQHVEPEVLVEGGETEEVARTASGRRGGRRGQEEMDLSSRSIESEASLCALTGIGRIFLGVEGWWSSSFVNSSSTSQPKSDTD